MFSLSLWKLYRLREGERGGRRETERERDLTDLHKSVCQLRLHSFQLRVCPAKHSHSYSQHSQHSHLHSLIFMLSTHFGIDWPWSPVCRAGCSCDDAATARICLLPSGAAPARWHCCSSCLHRWHLEWDEEIGKKLVLLFIVYRYCGVWNVSLARSVIEVWLGSYFCHLLR